MSDLAGWRWVRGHAVSSFWLWKSVIKGRLYFEGGGSERMSRRFVWQSLKPSPLFWAERHLMRLFPSTVTRKDCGCTYWFTRRRASCLTHLRDDWGIADG